MKGSCKKCGTNVGMVALNKRTIEIQREALDHRNGIIRFVDKRMRNFLELLEDLEKTNLDFYQVAKVGKIKRILLNSAEECVKATEQDEK